MSLSALGIYFAYLLHLKYREKDEDLARKFAPLTRLLEAKFWVDEIYQKGIVEPLRTLGRVFFGIDRFVIDGIVWILAFIPQAAGFVLKLTTQRGYLQGYAATMVLGVVIILVAIYVF